MAYKRFFLKLGIILCFFFFSLMSHNVFAIEYAPANFGLRYRDYNSFNYDWDLNLYAGQNYYVNGFGLNGLRIQWQNMTFQGNHASIHSEINVVAWEGTSTRRNQWVNLPYQGILTCASDAGNVEVKQSNVSSFITNWTAGDGSLRSTLTYYVDVALSGLNQNATGYISCLIGSNNYAFATNDTTTSTRYYVEQAPSRIEFSNNINDTLLQTQISQNETLININQQILDSQKQNTDDIINNQNQNTDDIINNQNQNTEDIIKSNQSCYENLMPLSGVDLSQSRTVSISGLSLSPGTYTLSYDLDEYSLGSTNSFFLYLWIDDLHLRLLTLNSNTSLGRKTYTFQLPSSGGSNSSFRLSTDSYNAGAWVKLSKIQLETGSSATPYTPYGEERCVNVNQEYYDEQRQADNNISSQSTSDISNSENSQTTSLIGVITSFVSAISSVQTGSCELSLPFPNFLGGDTTVNPCSGKDKAPTIISIASSMLLITVFVPLAFIVLKMIYNEIRSFTNG